MLACRWDDAFPPATSENLSQFYGRVALGIGLDVVTFLVVNKCPTSLRQRISCPVRRVLHEREISRER